MAPHKLSVERKLGSVTDVATRRSNRIAAASAHSNESDQIIQTAARAKGAKSQRRSKVEASQSGEATSAVRVINKKTSSIGKNRLPRSKRNAGVNPAEEASRASRKPRLSPGRTSQPTSGLQPGAAPVSRSAERTKKRPRGDDDDAVSPRVAGKRARVNDDNTSPEEILDAQDRAQTGDRTSVTPVEHAVDPGASKGMKRRSQEANDNSSSPVARERARKSMCRPLPAGHIGAPSDAPSEDSEHEAPPPQLSDGKKLSDFILLAVITHRVLRRKQSQHRCCERQLQEADRAISSRQRDVSNRFNYMEPYKRRAINREIEEWEALLPKRQAHEVRAGQKRRYLDRQVRNYIEKLPNFSHVSREDDALEFLAESNNFWQCFDRFHETSQAVDDLVIETEEAQQELKALDNAAELLRRRFELGDDPRIPVEMEQNICGDMDNSPVVMCRLDDLENRRAELKQKLRAAAIDVFWSAEEAFVSSGILEGDGNHYGDNRYAPRQNYLQEDWHEQEDWPEQIEQEDWHGREETRENEDASEQEGPLGNTGAPAELSIPEQLKLAQSVLQKARDEFEGARTLTQEEIARLPRPVTEDAMGVAMVQKLGRRTRALIDATQAWKDIDERARKAEFTSGREQTADYSDREDDGYPESLHEELIAQSSYRVERDWAGLHPIDREASPQSGQLDRSLLRLHSPGMGEDSFEETHARDRNRDRIDAVMVEGYNIRELSSFPEAEADELIFE